METNLNQTNYVYRYSNRYHGIKSHMHIFIYDNFCSKKMYDDFDPECILSKSHMIYNYIDNYLYDCKDETDLIYNYTNILRNIMSCMFTLNLRMRIIHGFFDIVVDYIIENNCYSKFDNIDDLIMIFTYISPEKLYDFILYIYKSSGEENKKYINNIISNKIYLSTLYNSAVITMTQYGYGDTENIGEIVYKYYMLITKLQKDGILVTYDEKMENTKYDLVQCSISEDIMYIIFLTNIIHERNIHINKNK